MPTYQYACTACDHRFEAVQAFTDDSLTVCPECEGRLRKVFSKVGVVFKGSGFYRTDSRAAAKQGSGDAKGETRSDAKSDSSAKPDTGTKQSADKTGSSPGSSSAKAPAASAS